MHRRRQIILRLAVRLPITTFNGLPSTPPLSLMSLTAISMPRRRLLPDVALAPETVYGSDATNPLTNNHWGSKKRSGGAFRVRSYNPLIKELLKD